MDRPNPGPSLTERSLTVAMITIAHDTRLSLGWSQRTLSRRSGVSQSMISRLETDRLENLDFGTTARLCDALGVRIELVATSPHLARDLRQRDAAHARCVAYVTRRLRSVGWHVAQEVEVRTGRSHGWIDVFAHHPAHAAGAVIEVKAGFPDVGEAQRQVAWYEREAWSVARRMGWQVRNVSGALLVLATSSNDRRISENSGLLGQAFPVRAGKLLDWLADPRPARPAADWR